MSIRFLRTRAACLTLVLGICAASAAQATIVTTNYTNPQTIIINDNQAASPYPSTIPVTALTGTINAVTVSLNGFSHTFPRDVYVSMIAPGGQQVVLMNRVGGGTDASNANLAFSAASTATLGAPVTSGTYNANLGVLNGDASAQNGVWQLFVSDREGLDVGQFSGGWTLSITRDTFTTCAAEGYTGSKLTLCRQICEIDQSPTRLAGLIKLYMGAFRSEPPCA